MKEKHGGVPSVAGAYILRERESGRPVDQSNEGLRGVH